MTEALAPFVFAGTSDKMPPVPFVEQYLRDPDNDGAPFQLYPDQESFLNNAFILTETGELYHQELLWSSIKKSGKTTLDALCLIYVAVVLVGRQAECYVVANDLEQAQSRVFKQVCRILECSPDFEDAVKITRNVVEFVETGATIAAIASDYAGGAGSNAHIVCFDELWGYRSEASRRLWDEFTVPPTRKIACRLTTTYAGFDGESVLLQELLARGQKGVCIGPHLYSQPGMLMHLSHEPIAPWQTQTWLNSMKATMRTNAYLRMICNRFVSSESGFVDLEWWDKCVDSTMRPVLKDMSRRTSIWVHVDASVKRDSTAVVAVTFDSVANKVRLICHRTFQPSPEDPLDFEATIETELLDLKRRFTNLRQITFDPYQMVSSAQRLVKQGLPMVEFVQSIPNLTEASTCLYELIKFGNLAVYPDPEMRRAISFSVAKETGRGWKISKEKQTHKIDLTVALASAALAAVKGGSVDACGGIF